MFKDVFERLDFLQYFRQIVMGRIIHIRSLFFERVRLIFINIEPAVSELIYFSVFTGSYNIIFAYNIVNTKLTN